MPVFIQPIHEHGDPSRPGPYPHTRGGKIRQQFGRTVSLSPALQERLAAIGASGTVADAEKPKQMAEAVKQLAPDLMAAASELVARGKEGQQEFKALAQTLATQFGYKLHTNIESREVLEDQNNYVVLGPVKSAERTAVKAALDYDGDTSLVKDVLRGTIAVNTAEELVSALARLSEAGDIRIVSDSLKDNVTRPMPMGYRDVNVLIRMPGSGMLAEMQLIVKPMLRAKMTVGHRLYEAWRVLKPDSAMAKDLFTQMQSVYNSAWAQAATSTVGMGALATLVQQIRGR